MYGGKQGIVQVKHNGTWNFINGTGWSYCAARVVCRELGEGNKCRNMHLSLKACRSQTTKIYSYFN